MAKKRPRRRRKRRLKKSVKIAMGIAILLIFFMGYGGIRYYNNIHAENPFGTVENVTSPEKESPFSDETDENSGEIAKYWIMDVGDGEAIFIKAGTKELLIDTGTEKASDKLVDSLAKEVAADLDYVILTNENEGRLGGISKIYDKFTVGETIMCSEIKQTASVMESINKSSVVRRGEEMSFKLGQGIVSILQPEVDSSDSRDRSLMVLFQYGDVYFFSESDAGVEEETRVSRNIPACDVLVLARNGSDDTNGLIDVLNAPYLVASTAKNSGRPSEKMLQACNGIFSTGKSGTLQFETDGTYLLTELDEDDLIFSEKENM